MPYLQAFLLVMLLLGLPWSGFAQTAPDVPLQYRRLFFHYGDSRDRYERALNLIGLSHHPVGRSYALIAGVTQYPNFPADSRSLRAAAVDIEKLKLYLRDQEFFDQIVVLKDGDFNLDNLDYFLNDYFPDHLKNSPHSRFLFAFSGHGYADGTSDTARGFLLKNSATTLSDGENRIDLTLLRTLLGPDIDNAEKTLVLINSCQSGAFLGRKPFGTNPLAPGDRGAHAIMASRTNQQSLSLATVGEGSVFFEKIFAGLEGAADNAPRDGVVTFHELNSYLRSEITLATDGAQIPMEGDISRNASVGEFFFLNRGRQVRLGNSKPWNPQNALAFGAGANDPLEQEQTGFSAGQYERAFQQSWQSATEGNADGMNDLGILYTRGYGVTQDYQKARQWYEKAAAAGNADGMLNLGFLYSRGYGVPPDEQQARQWFERAAAIRNAEGMLNLGILYIRDYGEDDQQSLRWFEKAADAGSGDAMQELGLLYEYGGHGATKDYKRARHWYERAAEAGSAYGMTQLGSLYEQGHGVARDYQEARKWYVKAAAVGNAKGMVQLGSLYEQGHGVARDYQEARKWYEKAACVGSEAGMSKMADLYGNGHGVAKDAGKMIQWSVIAFRTAMFSFGLEVLYEHGHALPRNYQFEREWLEKLAVGGNSDAMFRIGHLYDNGLGGALDDQQARQWYEKAAGAGNAQGMYALGRMYELGFGTVKDSQQAFHWIQKAAAAGDSDAIERLKDMKQ